MVEHVQAELERIYGMRCTLNAASFVIDEVAAKALGGTGRAEEELLVLEVEDGLELALCLSGALLQRLRPFEGAAPERVLQEALPAFCELAEGVSHFLYIVHAAEQNRRVSLLELEAQAEVDKFALCMLAHWDAAHPEWTQHLVSRLFDQVSYRPSLSTDERWRYQEANRVARRYCHTLVDCVRRRRLDLLLAELRYSYRLGAEAKLRRFAGTA